MKRRRRHRLRWLSLISLVVLGGTLVLWIRSDHIDSSVHFNTSDGHYTIQSFHGELALLGPSRDRIDDRDVQEWAGRMSGRDFDWQPARARDGVPYVKGIVRQGTPTLELFNRFHEAPRDPQEPARAQRLWLAALDDPERFVPASMMLMFLAEDWRGANVYVNTRIPYVLMPALRGQSLPDLSGRVEMRDQWHRRFDQHRLVVLWYAWPFLLAIFTLFVIVTRPRGETWTVARWSFNAAALFSLLALAGVLGCWIRSYRICDTWTFNSQTPASTPLPDVWMRQNPNAKTRFRLQVEVSRGRIFENDFDELDNWRAAGPRLTHATWSPTRSAGFGRLLGFDYDWMPARMVTPPNGAVYQVDPRMLGPLWLMPRQRVASIPLWFIALLAALAPAIWARKAWRRWQTSRRCANPCPVCSYDLRASPERCPECGTAVRKTAESC